MGVHSMGVQRQTRASLCGVTMGLAAFTIRDCDWNILCKHETVIGDLH